MSLPKRARACTKPRLIYLGLVLFFITFVVLTLSKLLLAQLRRVKGRAHERTGTGNA
jgi:ABC-type phosphate transport system permease subunit